MENPFKYGEIVEGDNFCNRTQELKQIKRAIINSKSFWINSPRRYGKSSLILKAFKELNEPDIITLYFDFYGIESLDEFARKYASLLAKCLFDWRTEIKKLSQKIGEYFKNLYPKISFDNFGQPSVSFEIKQLENSNDIETILKIPQQIAEKSRKKICIAFDEFQEVQRIKPFLINWMRTEFQHQSRVSYIFLGSNKSLMEFVFTDYNSPFYEYGFKLPIHPIKKEDLIAFITKRFSDTNLKIRDKMINSILTKSRNHPHFTQYFAAVVWELIYEGISEDSPDFEYLWMNRIIASQSMIFQNIYDQLSSNQRRTLHALSELRDNKLFSSRFREEHDLPQTSSLTTTLNSLINKNLVIKTNGSYQIQNPVFEEWLKTIKLEKLRDQ